MHTQRKFSGSKAVRIGIALLAAGALLSLLIPSGAVSFSRLLQAFLGRGDSAAGLILWKVRAPRILAGVVCGTALAVSGELLQEALDNHLCAPGIMGINAGAGLTVLLAGLFFPGILWIRGTFAFCGALISTLIVFCIARAAGFSRSAVILAGVAVSSLMTALINVIVTVRPDTVADKVAFSLGGLQYIDLRQLILSGIFTLAGCAAAMVMAPGIELFALGDEIAQGLGLPVKKYRAGTVLIAAFLAASAVSVCGLLGFVGLIIPNLFRMAGISHVKDRVILSGIWGGAFLVLADLAARTLFYPYELPAGVLLSCLGTPFFIYILTRRRRRSVHA